MNNLYGDALISNLKKKKSNSVKLLVFIMLAATVINIALLLLSNEENSLLMKILTSIIYVGSGWFSLWLLFNVIFACTKRLDVIEELTGCDDEYEILCDIISVGNPITLSDSFRYYVITAFSDKKEIKLYFDESFNVSEFLIGSKVKFKVVDGNYVIAYEVL